MRLAQIGLELVIVASVIIFATIVVLALQTDIFSALNNEMSSATVTTALDQIVGASENMYKQGVGATTQVKVKIPSNIKASKITGGAVSFTLSEGGRNSTIAKETDININGSLPSNQGTYILTVRSEKDFVNVSFQ